MKILQNFWVKTTIDAGRGWVHDKSFRLGAALAFFSIFSLAPLLLISLGLVGLFFDPAAAKAELQTELARFVSENAAETMVEIAQQTRRSEHSVWATVLGFCALTFGATSVFNQMQDSLNYIWGVEGKPDKSLVELVYRRIIALGMILVIGALLLISIALSSILSAVWKLIAVNISLPEWAQDSLNVGLSFLIIAALFTVIFKVMPQALIQWRYARFGALVTASLFILGKYLLAWYLGRDSLVSAYGAAGALVLVLMWIYYSALILFFGAELTKAYALNSGATIEPTGRAVKVNRVRVEAEN